MNISFFLLLCSILATAIVSGNQPTNGGMNAYTLNITGPFTHTLNVPFLNYTTFLPFRVSFSITTGKNTENNNSTRGLLLFGKANDTPCMSQADCAARATELGLELGSEGLAFNDSSYSTKGCHTYDSGQYQGYAYYGTGGTSDDEAAVVSSPITRVLCRYECENSIYVYIASNGKINFGVKKCDDEDTSSAPLESNIIVRNETNYHIICIYNGTDAMMYVNNVLAASEKKLFNFSSSITNFALGTGAFSGDVDKFNFGVIQNIVFEPWNPYYSYSYFNNYENHYDNDNSILPQYGDVAVTNFMFLWYEVQVNNGVLNITGITDTNSSTYMPDMPFSRTHAIIFGNDTHRFFKVVNGGSLILSKLLLVGGTAEGGNGGGIYVEGSNANLMVDTVIFAACYASDFGGALYIKNAKEITLTNTIITDNHGGGIYVHGENETNPTLLITENVIYWNNNAEEEKYSDLFCEKHCIYRTIISDTCNTHQTLLMNHQQMIMMGGGDSDGGDGGDSFVLCPGNNPSDYCDCGGDCVENPSYCSCSDAQACCSGGSSSAAPAPTDPCADNGKGDGWYAEIGTVLQVTWSEGDTEYVCKVDTNCDSKANAAVCEVAFDYRDGATSCERVSDDGISNLIVADDQDAKTCA